MRKRQVVIKRVVAQEERRNNSTNSAHAYRNVRYLECQKNHAADIGGYALDGCREFMASGVEGSELEHVCAACGCHRGFHRRVDDTEVVASSH